MSTFGQPVILDVVGDILADSEYLGYAYPPDGAEGGPEFIYLYRGQMFRVGLSASPDHGILYRFEGRLDSLRRS